jgi:hypothetical protein
VPRSALQGAARNVSPSHGFSQVRVSDEVERLRRWPSLEWLLTGHGYAKRFGVRNDEGSSAFVGAETPLIFSRFSGRNGQPRSVCKQLPTHHRTEFEREGVVIHRIPATQKQQGHPQQAQAEAVESLGFADLLRSARWSSSASWSAG